eukprot:Blabericola_migrator_1__5064@NODE_2622_length_2526_cov_33_929646_g1643_i0_p1_GENE_NODE_2622_length_2526_cov_33_929646_g1643_i0NODE_2622_length_2526_cov_33_929646_g1643_i0_p1_ORF_typecomplete_len157_score22_35_NODE_2622_length_2526_cov_33_929646_g1643_i015652035
MPVLKKVLTQTSTLLSLFQRVKRLTLDSRVQALIPYLFVLNSFISGVGGAPTSVGALREIKIDQQLWDEFICSAMQAGTNIILSHDPVTHWEKPSTPPSDPISLMICTPADDTMTAKALEIWRTLLLRVCPPQGISSGAHITYANGETRPDLSFER